MSLNRELQALAYLISQARPSWPRAAVERALATRITNEPTPDQLAQLLADCADATLNPDLHSPGVLAHHRRPERPLVQSAIPKLDKCQRCGHLTCVCNATSMPPTVRDFIAEDNLLATQQIPYRRRLVENPDDRESRQLLAALTERRDRLREELESA